MSTCCTGKRYSLLASYTVAAFAAMSSQRECVFRWILVYNDVVVVVIIFFLYNAFTN